MDISTDVYKLKCVQLLILRIYIGRQRMQREQTLLCWMICGRFGLKKKFYATIP